MQDAGDNLCVQHTGHRGLRMWHSRGQGGCLEEEVGPPAPRCDWSVGSFHPLPRLGVPLCFPGPQGHRER